MKKENVLTRQKKSWNLFSLRATVCALLVSAFVGTTTAQERLATESNDNAKVLKSAAVAGAFSHKVGGNFSALKDNGMQMVHEYNRVVYMASAETRILQGLQQVSREYVRWYNYDTDNGFPYQANSNVAGGLNGMNVGYVSIDAVGVDGRGIYCKSSTVPNVTFKQTTPAATFRIGCDQSTYTDVTIVNNALLVEPTLSQRIIYEIHPAKEMSDRLSLCTGDRFLEEYEMIVPAGKMLRVGPEYAYIDTVSDTNAASNRVYNYSNYYITPTQKLSGAVWKRNGTPISTTCYKFKSGTAPNEYQVTNGRVLQIKARTVGTVDTLTLTCTYNSITYNIARFVLKNEAVAEVGPIVENTNTHEAIISDERIAEEYIVIAARNFNFGLPNPNVTTRQIYDTTLQLQESNYGYANLTGDIGRNSSSTKVPGMAEYFFANRFIYDKSAAPHIGTIEHRTGVNKGYFMYVDAADESGVTMNLEFEGNFCPNAKLAFSAWVANMEPRTEKHLAPVNLNFILTGIDENGIETPITTYTTGDITVSQQWHQVFFDISLQKSYLDYRLQIVNNAWGSLGNNLVIDDIEVLLKKPSVITYQTLAECDAENDIVTSVIRLTYAELQENDWIGKPIYYQWKDDKAGTVMDMDYLNKNNSYGSFVIPSPQDTAALSDADFYPYAETFLAETDLNKKIGYVYETINGRLYLRIYIKHKDIMYKGQTYTARLAVDPSALEDTVCGVFSSIMVNAADNLLLDNVIQSSTVVTGLCNNQQYEVQMQIYQPDMVDDNRIALLSGQCLCDWFIGNPKQKTDEENILEYGYTYTEMEYAIRALRDIPVNYTVTNLDDAVLDPESSSVLDDAKMTILRHLVQSDFLILAQKKYRAYITDGEDEQLIIYPIVGTGTALADSTIEIFVCPNELEINLEAQNVGSDTLQIGAINEILPVALENQPRVFRMSAQQANNRAIAIPIKKAYNATITGVTMIATTDPSVSTEIPFLFDNPQPVVTTVSDTIKITKVNGNGFVFTGGYEYLFEIDKNTTSRDCSSDSVSFIIKVVQDTAVWAPTSGNTSWNNDANWRTCDYKGQNLRAGYVPMSHTSVIIPNNGTNTYPALIMPTAKTATQLVGIESSAQNYITYDYHYNINTCHNIYFMDDAMMLNQHLLNYNAAWVDIKLQANLWSMISSPLKGIVTGDFYIPKTGNVDIPFQTGTVDGRTSYYVWQSLYNAASSIKNNRGQNRGIYSTTWTAPVNVVSTELPEGQGNAIRVQPTLSNQANVIFKLPKTDTLYYYYTEADIATEYAETVTRPDDYGKLAYAPLMNASDTAMTITLQHHNPGNIFLFGNPTMAYIDLSKFFEHNTQFTGTYYALQPYENKPDKIVNISYTMFLGNAYLAPMHSVLLEYGGTASPSIDLEVTPSMLTLKTTGGRVQKSAKQKLGNSELRITALRNGTYSQTIVAENQDASDDIVLGEDADLLMYDVEKTPSAIYSIAQNMETGDRHSLSVNVLKKMNLVPLAVNEMDRENEAETIDLTFDGVSSFSNDLLLFDAYTGQTTILEEGMTVTLQDPGNDVVRYFIQVAPQGVSTDNDILEGNNSLQAYVADNRMVIINSDINIKQVDVCNVVGQIIRACSNIDYTSYTLQLAQGIYLLNIQTENGTVTKRVIVK